VVQRVVPGMMSNINLIGEMEFNHPGMDQYEV